MPRSVVRAGAPRCHSCRLAPRWCICDSIPVVETGIHVDVLMHRNEQWKPSSTGKLVERAVKGARCHVFDREKHRRGDEQLAAAIPRAGRELWILHPLGEPIPDRGTAGEQPAVQVLLLDASWRQAGEMLRAVNGLGKRVCLPAMGPSRYWLRHHPKETHLSTAEALLGIFGSLGDATAAARFRLHFELHVYATLLSRGRRQLAEAYLESSPLQAALPEVLARLEGKRSGG